MKEKSPLTSYIMIHFHDIKIESQTEIGKHTKNLSVLLAQKSSLNQIDAQSLILTNASTSQNAVVFLKMLEKHYK